MEPRMHDPTLPPEMQESIGDSHEGGEDKNWNLFEGIGGIPFRTRNEVAPIYKDDDPDKRRPQIENEIDVAVFDMSAPDDMKRYKKILNFCAQGLGRLVDRYVEYDANKLNWRVFLSWTQYYYQDARETQQEHKKYYGDNGGNGHERSGYRSSW
ncbi:MAG TPA: hypothetical protein ENH11_04700 [Candidatus Acetothermia bacterium]|nr:hypothetical protein [Candidatus Acetothermia bacterium]